MSKRTQKMGATPILGDGTHPRKKKTSVFAVNARSESSAISDGTSDRQNPCQKEKSKGRRSELFSINDTPPRLEIQSVPIAERVDPKRNSYILVIQPVGVRAAGGQYTADEANEIAGRTKGWDFSLDKDGRPRCLPRLVALLEQICERSAKVKFTKNFPNEGGEA